jgi:hypothetical protein
VLVHWLDTSGAFTSGGRDVITGTDGSTDSSTRGSSVYGLDRGNHRGSGSALVGNSGGGSAAAGDGTSAKLHMHFMASASASKRLHIRAHHGTGADGSSEPKSPLLREPSNSKEAAARAAYFALFASTSAALLEGRLHSMLKQARRSRYTPLHSTTLHYTPLSLPLSLPLLTPAPFRTLER